VPEEEVAAEKNEEPKWYESQTMVVTVGLALSVSSIALLLLLA
jgi:hypothetical protein